MAQLYIFTCPHGKHCNVIADCNECAKAEIERLRCIVKITKSNVEILSLLAEDDDIDMLKQQINTTYKYLEDNNTFGSKDVSVPPKTARQDEQEDM